MDELEQLGRYKLQRVLGRGAMGVVYEGVDPRLNRPVAVKTILKSQLSTPELAAEYQARFEREAQAVARLNHPNIVGVFDFGEENNVAYIVMELIRGDELKSYFDRKTVFSLADAVRMTSELLDALGYAHEQGIVHRDIKPANIMLDAQLRVKLTDFGVARLSEAGSEHTQAGTMVGTPSYMSPEQITGNPVGPRSDLFAAGIVLYQLLTGERPFSGTGHWAVQRQIVEEQPVPPSELNPDLDPALDAIVYRALAKNPESRYPYARAFKEDLRRVLDGRQTEIDDATLLIAASERSAIRRPADEGTARRAAPVRDDISATEIEFWRSIKDSEDADEFDLYLAKFPAGTYAGLARRKLSKLRGETTGTSTAPIPSAVDADARTMLLTPGTAAAAAPAPAPKAAGGKRVAAASVAAAAVGLAAGIYFFMKPASPPPAPVAAADRASVPASGTPLPPVASTAPALSNVPAASAAPATPGGPSSAGTPAALPSSPSLAAPSSAQPEATASTPPSAPAQPAAAAASREAPSQGTDAAAPGSAARNAANESEQSAKPAPASPAAAERNRPEAQPRPTAQAAAEAARAAAARSSEAAARRERPALAEPKGTTQAAPALATAPSPAAPAPAEPPAAVAMATPAATVSVSPAELIKQAQAQEQGGNLRQAIALYKRAALAGSGSAAKTLGDIYGNGRANIGRDYAESLRWYNLARSHGIDVPTVGVR